MKLSEIFEELAYGELSDLSMCEGGEVKPESQPKIVIKLNDVLQSLYTKYVIKTEYMVLDTSIKALTYQLDDPHSVKIVYIQPNVVDDVEIYKNRDYFNVRGNTIVFIKEPIADTFNLTFQWKPLKLAVNPSTRRYLDQEVEIDPVIVPLVRLYVASAIFQGMNGELHKKTGIELLNQAQFVQADLELSGALAMSVGFANNRFKVNGFT